MPDFNDGIIAWAILLASGAVALALAHWESSPKAKSWQAVWPTLAFLAAYGFLLAFLVLS